MKGATTSAYGQKDRERERAEEKREEKGKVCLSVCGETPQWREKKEEQPKREVAQEEACQLRLVKLLFFLRGKYNWERDCCTVRVFSSFYTSLSFKVAKNN